MRAPSFQFYPKQWLGDDKIMAMSWDARAMHMHLICIAWQQDPPCTLPDDDAMIQRWLGSPRKWQELRNQIFTAWKKVDGRWVQSGLVGEYEKQSAYRESRKKNADSRWGNDAYASSLLCTDDALLSSTSTSTSIQETTNVVSSLKSSDGYPIEMTLVLNTGEEFGVTQKQIQEWSLIYPGIDVRHHFRRMKGWCISNPTKRKTHKGILRFINNWLAKAQDDQRNHVNGGYSNGRSNDPRVVAQSARDVVGRSEANGSSNGGIVCDPQSNPDGRDDEDLLADTFVRTNSAANQEPHAKIIEGV